MNRKITQISTAIIPETEDEFGKGVLIALCDDGTLWQSTSNSANYEFGGWERILDIPQD